MVNEWKNAVISPPKVKGPYLVGEIKRTNSQMEIKTAIYLKKGDEYIIRQEPVDLSKVENQLMFSICKHDTVVVASRNGFYEIIQKTVGNDIVYMNQEKLVWQMLPCLPGGVKNEFDVVQDRLRAYHDNVDIERREVLSKIGYYVRNEGRLADVMNTLSQEFSGDFYESCGVMYKVSVSEIEKSFLRALIIRDEIKRLENFDRIKEVCQLSFNREQIKNFSAEEAISLRNELSEYMVGKEYVAEDVNLISDAFFTYIFLPTKKEMLRVMYKDEKEKSVNDDRNSFYTRLYQRYILNQSIRTMAACFNGKSVPKDGIMDNISLKDVTVSLSITKFGIEYFTDRFEEEMGIR